MLRQVEGSHAVAEAVALCRPQVICAYPISPQTHIVEGLGEMVKSGELERCEFINVESEFAAMSVAIGASAAGVRAYTATASQGLLYMAEAVFNASGLGLPIVMTVANRAIGAPINIWNDHTDAMSQRDCGWIQLFAENNQEALDLHIQAFKLAEEIALPVMVCMDGFVLTHAYERVDVPEQESVDAFLPPYEPRQVLDPSEPVAVDFLNGCTCAPMACMSAVGLCTLDGCVYDDEPDCAAEPVYHVPVRTPAGLAVVVCRLDVGPPASLACDPPNASVTPMCGGQP